MRIETKIYLFIYYFKKLSEIMRLVQNLPAQEPNQYFVIYEDG